MSIISSLAELFRRSAVPSIEATTGLLQGRVNPITGNPYTAGEIRERSIENIRRLVGENVTISGQTLGTAISRIQTALQRGASIERGETVPRQLIPSDPTLPIGTEFRYRVRLTYDVADPIFPDRIQTIDTVIPIDSESELSRQQLHDMARQAGEEMAPREPSPKFRTVGETLRTQEIINFRAEVISVYRSPIG